MILRPKFVFLHRWVGLALAAFLTLAGLTGSVIAFSDELDAWLNPDWFDTPAASLGKPPLPPQAIIDRIEAQRPDSRVNYITYRSAPALSVRAYLQARGTTPIAEDEVFADPVTGRVLGGRLHEGCCLSRRVLIPFIYRFHYTLALGSFGQWVMGIAAILWMADCINGFYLTLPPRLTTHHRRHWHQWRLAWTIALHRGGIRRIFDLHRAVSLWLWVVLFGIAMSGVSLALPRVFSSALHTVLPAAAPTRAGPAPASPPRNLDQQAELAFTAARHAGWTGGMPRALYRLGDRTIFYFNHNPSGRDSGLGFWTVTIAATGAAQVHKPTDGRAGDLVDAMQMPWHSGRLIGLPGRILICLSGLATALLSVTGVLIWWRKRSARAAMERRRAKTARHPAAPALTRAAGRETTHPAARPR